MMTKQLTFFNYALRFWYNTGDTSIVIDRIFIRCYPNYICPRLLERC